MIISQQKNTNINQLYSYINYYYKNKKYYGQNRYQPVVLKCK